MPAFNLEHERARLVEPGLTYGAKVKSTRDNLRTLVAERTESPSFFELKARNEEVTSVGYEHRGDLDNSYKKSVENAPNERIANRYNLENKGYLEAKKKFFELPIGSTVLLFSPPPDEEIPGYPGHSYAYFYHILPGETESERTIKALAWVNRFTKNDQAEILNSFDENVNTLPTEESILTSPVSVSSESEKNSFDTVWSSLRGYFKNKGYDNFYCPPSNVMQQLLLNGENYMQSNNFELEIMIDSLAHRLSNGEGKNEIADDFDTMLKRGDRDFLYKNWGLQKDVHMNTPINHATADAYIVFARNRNSEQVRQVMTFCGMSSGMDQSNMKGSVQGSQINTWSFNVNKGPEQPSGETILCCTCPFCEKEVDARISEGKISCPNCKKSAPYSKSA